jgi:flavin-dependent dehydrogenase
MSILNTSEQNNEYDVVICGGGLAGQTLARQLKLNDADISILILEKATFPVAVATHKVGESLIELSSYYLAEVLHLQDYLNEHHFKKLGLRYFWSHGEQCLSERPEFGLSGWPSYDSYQIDRGVFENDLYSMNKRLGIKFYERVSVKDIHLAQDNQWHEITYKNLNEKSLHHLKARWVVDAMGRRCFLQKKLNLRLKSDTQYNAVWFRLKGRFDISDLVPESKRAWHQRVPNRIRYYSTNHFMGNGYWIWLIPLASAHTSVGIVTEEALQPFSGYNTYEKVKAWLAQHEPMLHDHLQDYSPLDFLKVRDYSFSSKQIFSAKRWACIGDAALFPDPFFSPGVVLMGYENSIVTKMIELDMNAQLTADEVARFNRLIISRNDVTRQSFQSAYSYFDNAPVTSIKLLWDILVGWIISVPEFFNALYLDHQTSRLTLELTWRYFSLIQRMDDFLKEWAALSVGRFTFQHIDYLSIPFVKEVYKRNTTLHQPLSDVIKNYRHGLRRLEEFAQVIFLMAVEDVIPEKLSLFPDPIWLNAWAISLTPEQWQKDGLFNPKSKARNLNEVREQIKSLYIYRQNDEEMALDLEDEEILAELLAEIEELELAEVEALLAI